MLSLGWMVYSDRFAPAFRTFTAQARKFGNSYPW